VANETRITGLTSTPIVLHSAGSQTYVVFGREGHEAIQELICEPEMEPGLTNDQRKQLQDANIRLIYFYRFRFSGVMEKTLLLGFDDLFREP